MENKTIKPDHNDQKTTETNLTLIGDFLQSLEIQSDSPWERAVAFSLPDRDARIQVFGMSVLVPGELLSQKEWCFRVSEPSDGIRVLSVNGRALGASLSGPVTPGQTMNLPHEILCLNWEEYPFKEAPKLDGFSQLTALSLIGCGAVDNLSALSELANLTELYLLGCEALQDLEPLSRLIKLNQLSVVYSETLIDLSPLSQLTQLKHLDLRLNCALVDVSPLAALLNLESLNIGGCAPQIDSSPLSDLPKLDEIELRTPVLLAHQEDEIREHLG